MMFSWAEKNSKYTPQILFSIQIFIYLKDKMNPDIQPNQQMYPDFVQSDLKEVEEEYWYLITERDSYVQVQHISITTGFSSVHP